MDEDQSLNDAVLLQAPKRNSIRAGGQKMSFSLIELLIVMAMLSILVSLLQPAFRNILIQSRTLTCTSHQNNISTAATLHKADLADYLPLGGEIRGMAQGLITEFRYKMVDNKPTHFVGSLSEYMGIRVRMDSVGNHLMDLNSKDKLPHFQCPEDKNNYLVLLLHPADHSQVISGGRAVSSYGPNASLVGYYNGLGAAGDTRAVLYPSTVMFIGDTQAISQWNWNVMGAPTSVDKTLADHINDSIFGPRFAFDRHNGQMVTSFVDGHVRAIPPEELGDVGTSKGIKLD